MKKNIKFEQYAVDKYGRVTNEVSQNINKIAISFENDEKEDQAKELKTVMEKVCDINYDLEKPDWTVEQLKSNAGILKNAINKLNEQEPEDMRIAPEKQKLQGLYDCWKRLFGIDFDKENN